MKRFIPLVLLVLLLVAATSVNNVGGTKIKSFTVAAGSDTSITIADIGGTNAKPTWSRITAIGIRNGGSTGTDSLGLHLSSGWTLVPYPQGVSDFFEIRLQLMFLIHRASAKADTVLRYDNNSAAAARIYLWGM